MQKRTSSTSTNSFGTSASTVLVPEKYPKIQKRTIKDIPFEAPQKKPRHSAMPAHMASVQDILTTWHGANHNRESSNVEMARQLVSKNAFRYSKVSHVCLWLFSCVLYSLRLASILTILWTFRIWSILFTLKTFVIYDLILVSACRS